jgi:hypothetical protein
VALSTIIALGALGLGIALALAQFAWTGARGADFERRRRRSIAVLLLIVLGGGVAHHLALEAERAEPELLTIWPMPENEEALPHEPPRVPPLPVPDASGCPEGTRWKGAVCRDDQDRLVPGIEEQRLRGTAGPLPPGALPPPPPPPPPG